MEFDAPSRILKADSDSGTLVDPCDSQKVQSPCHVRHLDCEESSSTLQHERPLLLCLPTSLTYVYDAYLFTVGLVVLPMLSRMAFLATSTSTSILGFLGSLTWFAIGCGTALFPSIINPHDVGYFYVIQYAKFWFLWWRCICHNVLPYFPLPTSTPVQNHIVNPSLKILFVLSFTLCTQNMYSQLLKCHKIPPYERKSFRVLEAIMTEVGFIYGTIIGCFGSFLCRIEVHITREFKRCLNTVPSTKDSEVCSPSRQHRVEFGAQRKFRTYAYYMFGLKNSGSVTSAMKRWTDNIGLDAFLS